MLHAVLDHGYVRFIEAWGHGEADSVRGLDVPRDMEPGIIEAARMSTQASFRGWNEDQKLLSFLFNNKPPHAGPFEFAGMVVEVQAPIFVFREWHRHRTQSYNEMSARYAPLPDLNYIPTVERMLLGRDTKNRQAKAVEGSSEITTQIAEDFRDVLDRSYQKSEYDYQEALKNGIPKEVARILLPVGRYSRMRASANLRNWLAFMTLRADPNAQWEIQQFAGAVGNLVADTFPRTWQLFHAARQK